MNKKKAMGYLADGHTFWTVEGAREVCKAVGLEFLDELIEHYDGQKDANPDGHPKGLWLNEDKPVDGVSALSLSDWVADQFGLKVDSYFGRGTQARANAKAIAEHLGV